MNILSKKFSPNNPLKSNNELYNELVNRILSPFKTKMKASKTLIYSKQVRSLLNLIYSSSLERSLVPGTSIHRNAS